MVFMLKSIRCSETNLFDVVKKFNIVVTPNITLAGSAFHSIQKVTNEDVTKINPIIHEDEDLEK